MNLKASFAQRRQILPPSIYHPPFPYDFAHDPADYCEKKHSENNAETPERRVPQRAGEAIAVGAAPHEDAGFDQNPRGQRQRRRLPLRGRNSMRRSVAGNRQRVDVQRGPAVNRAKHQKRKENEAKERKPLGKSAAFAGFLREGGGGRRGEGRIAHFCQSPLFSPPSSPHFTRPIFFSSVAPMSDGLSQTALPETIAPAWPMRRPGGAVRPAMNPATGLVMFFLIHAAASSSALPPISPIISTPAVCASDWNIFSTSMKSVPFTGSPPMPTQVLCPLPRHVTCHTAS